MRIAAASSLCHGARNQQLVSTRARELAALRHEWQRSTSGELRVALVLGDAGTGKTRLADELVPRCTKFPIRLLAHNCLFHSMPPLGPWAEALRLRAGGHNGDRACHICGSGLDRLSPLVRRAGTVHDQASCTEALRYHLVEWIPGLLATASRDRPIVLVLDDVHRSDDAVWQMLLRLGRDCPGSRLFVLATARPAELAKSRTALEALHALEQGARVRRIALAPLSRQDLQELVADTLGQDRAPAALVDWLTARAQGNLRFAVGLLEALAESDADVHAPVLDRVPERLARWIRTELAQVDPPALAVLELLAVAGEVMDPDDLAAITRLPAEHVAVILEQLSRAGTVIERQREGSLGYGLARVLTREVLYSDIGAARRRVLHRRVAAALLASGRNEAAVSQYIRAAQAGDGEAVVALVELVRRAREHSFDALAWRAVSALQDLLPAGDDRWNQVLDALAWRPNWGIVDRPEHYVAEIGAVQQMRQLLPRVTDLQRQAAYRLWLAGLFAYGAGNVEAGVRECWQAFALCQQAGCGVAARSAAIELAKIRGWSGDLRGEEVAAQQLLSEAEQNGDQRGIAEALAALGHTLGWQGRFDAAEKVLLRSVDLAATAAQLPWMSQSLALLACLDACRGDLISARARCAQAAASSPPDDPTIGRCGEFIELLAGDLIMAQAHARAAQRHEPAARCRMPVRLASRAAMAAAELGDLTGARRHLHEITCPDSGRLGILEPLHWWAEGVVARAEGRPSAAATALRRAVEGYTAMGAYALRGFVLADLAEVTVSAGDGDAGDATASITQWAGDNARRTGAPIHQTLQLLVTAWALIGQHRHDAAARAARQAVEGFSARGYALLAARARVTYADAIQRFDRHAAEEALRTAAATFEECGATMRYQEVRTRLRQLGLARRCTAPTEPTLASLTRRERQVAALAAGGYTAAQIAAQLHIGVRTVETHLARSYPKLGITCKQQLVHRAAELGFTPGP
ncbi:MAG: AAA family ATPase [Pseudonocardiales bacterium]|nr:AAA family ATPase [Pseudonocardiales bacterium]MBV9652203.1 AAA family ATPase [Pseudonocardiales bacterium]